MAKLVFARGLQFAREIAARNGVNGVNGLVQRHGDGEHQPPCQEKADSQQHHRADDANDGELHAARRRIRTNHVTALVERSHKIVLRLEIFRDQGGKLLIRKPLGGHAVPGAFELPGFGGGGQYGFAGLEHLVQRGLFVRGGGRGDDTFLHLVDIADDLLDFGAILLSQHRVGGDSPAHDHGDCRFGGSAPAHSRRNARVDIDDGIHRRRHGAVGAVLRGARQHQHTDHQPQKCAPQLAGDADIVKLHGYVSSMGVWRVSAERGKLICSPAPR